jgi:hypothetical protein
VGGGEFRGGAGFEGEVAEAEAWGAQVGRGDDAAAAAAAAAVAVWGGEGVVVVPGVPDGALARVEEADGELGAELVALDVAL